MADDASNHVTRGSRRNHERCRRTRRRVATTIRRRASARAAGSGVGPGSGRRRIGTVEDLEELAVADGASGGLAVAQPRGGEPADLVEQPGREHAVDALLDAGVELGGVAVEPDEHGAVPGCAGAGQARRERRPGDLHDLQGAHDPAAVAGQDSGGRVGVDPCEPGVQRRRAGRGELRLEPGADGGVGTGEAQVVDEGLHVEPRAADGDRGPAALQDVVDGGAGVALVRRDGGGLGDLEDVEQVVRDAAAGVDGQLRGADVHPAVELHGVGVDDLDPGQVRGQVEGQVGLARRRRPDEGDGAGAHGRHASSVDAVVPGRAP